MPKQTVFSRYLLLSILAQLVQFGTGEFVQVPSVPVPYPGGHLQRASKIGVGYNGMAMNWTSAKLKNFALSLDFEFGPVNFFQFRQLKQTYSGWSASGSTVIYDAQRNYTLLDFLPRAMQAVSGLHFHAQYHNFSLPSFITGKESRQETQSVQLTVNCWCFAYDVLFAAGTKTDKITLAIANPPNMWDVLTNPLLSNKFRSSVDQPDVLTDPTLRNRGLQPGDFLLVYHQNPGQNLSLDHVAIFIDDDLYFEKAGSGDNTPFRLVDWAGLTADWVPIVFHFQWRAPVSKVKRVFPPAAETFGLQNLPLTQEFPLLKQLKPSVAEQFTLAPSVSDDGKTVIGNTYLWVKELPLLVATGPFATPALDPSVFSPGGLMITVPKDIYQN